MYGSFPTIELMHLMVLNSRIWWYIYHQGMNQAKSLIYIYIYQTFRLIHFPAITTEVLSSNILRTVVPFH
jgi:hypothetical protein